MIEELPERSLATQVERLGELLRQRGLTVAIAESCTAGWIGKALTDGAGSSDYFVGGLITYTDHLKHILLNVTQQALERHGAVSEQVVQQMAAGAQAVTGASVTVAVSGIAGPGGATDSKPVGLVCFGWADPNGQLSTAQQQFSGDRDSVRRQAVSYALAGLERVVLGVSK